MPKLVSYAVVRDDPPQVFVAEDQDTLNWVLALHLIARTPGRVLPERLRDQLRQALRDEQWGEAVELWMHDRAEVDVYPRYRQELWMRFLGRRPFRASAAEFHLLLLGLFKSGF